MSRDIERTIKEDLDVRALCTALQATCGNEDLMLKFLRDLLTFEELRRVAHRWAVARKLLQGKKQVEVAKELALSTKTVSNVAQWVKGPYATGGFAEVFHLEQEK